MLDYYARRAAEYERIYDKPERQRDLRLLRNVLSTTFAGEHLLEVACGTGYWSAVTAQSAASILVTDANSEVLDLARRKDYAPCTVEFRQDDAYALESVTGAYTAGFHGFWWSHIPQSRKKAFLQTFHARLAPGARVVMLDNAFVTGSNTPISRRDEEGNTYQIRRLEDGSEYEVLKNFPTDEELRSDLFPHASGIEITRHEYYWMAQYRLA
ncbi:methyltransferase [Acidihalobacter aeolianus]|uniref:Methyltransferase n=1 Tax=Acidihalobacter aeolianus TaxID=2792603 RepID=A0A1D8K7T9_9GAMM|nr:class I SAM-dependent methyltransferase [Acidihalobacter aeolianus]AOV17035.1 methyltransferase [Acidihalobacter aeolianus]